ncbi:MAG: cell wall metabolism sensor histidine kinase WalK [Defluviitaleaceae bacterium]|nr:cell wall metabolism sensor histidine kinase WalK [Defluviitaleaceae bacterium]
MFFNSIFGKNLAIYVSIILISFTVLGTSLSQIYRSYFIERQERTLIERSERLATLLFEQALAAHGPFAWILQAQYQELIETEARNLQEYLGYIYFVVNQDFLILSPSDDLPINDYIHIDIETLPELTSVMDGHIVRSEGTLSGLFMEPKLTIVYPIGNDEITIGAIVMSTSMESLNENISEVVRITVNGVIISCIAAFIMISFSSRNITKPLRQMNDAAKVIASGDFEKRIEVKSLDEIGQLAESFNNMAEALNMQETSRRGFVANISHDLRSPLTSIIGFLEAMKDGTIPTERNDYYLDIVLSECKRLAKIANDLLDISKIELTGELELLKEDFELNKLIRDTLIQFENRVKQKNIKAEISFAGEDTMVFGDYEKIQRVVYNLLDNAIKFTPEDGRVRIETTIKDKKIFVSIRDSGRGLKEEERQHVFERFYKADSSRGIDKTGAGLGLSIVREFIKAHGEKIYVESIEGLGCNFIFTLSLTADEKAKRRGLKKEKDN